MIAANWPEIIGTLLLVLGAIGSLVAGGVVAYRKLRPSKPITGRSADAGPPVGAVEWVADIRSAMGSSHAEHVVLALLDGCCRDDARARRIKQLEGFKPVPAYTVHSAIVAAVDKTNWTAELKQ